MNETQGVQEYHRKFSAECFNGAWDLIDQDERSEPEQLKMIARAIASLWHWEQREDKSDRTLSVGNWQVSRTLALAGEARLALRFAQRSLEYSSDADPFYRGYAYEALARAAAGQADRQAAQQYLAQAQACAHSIDDPQNREALATDLQAVERLIGSLPVNDIG